MTRLIAVLISCLALSAQEALGCQRINDFVKDIENGKSEVLFDADIKLIDTEKKGLITTRRYSVHLPRTVPSEIMQLEIVDDDFYAKRGDPESGKRSLRIRPYSVSHWIDVSPSAVTNDIYDVIETCPQTKSEACGGFAIHFESKDAALEIGYVSYLKDDKQYVDQVML
jgi:hypothetical protein